MATPRVTRIVRIGLSVADLTAATRFYAEGLGFAASAPQRLDGKGFGDLHALPGARAQAVTLTLGRQQVELLRFEPAGLPYPAARAANDPWFQHFAVVVSDMAAAHAILAACAQAPISLDGPQLLPPSTGSVTAYKFRDPEGHPLELSHIPGGFWADPANAPASGAIFLGVDHSALAVADLAASLRFYVERLGLRRGAGSQNRGPTQDRLDGLAAACVDIATLHPSEDQEPHIELLAYRTPVSPRPPIAWAPNDVAAVRLVLEVEGLDEMAADLKAHGVRFVSTGDVVMDGGSRRALVRDPDGHLLELVETR